LSILHYQLEIACFTPGAALAAQHAGAHRIELCDNPLEGGTTPSLSAIELLRKQLTIQLFPIIRPRGGDFLYDELEFEIMKRDIAICRSLGCDGVVTGILNADATVDIKKTAVLREIAYPMELTFHRAFDRVKDPFEALEDIIELGCNRILSSGLHPTAPEGASLIKQLIQQASDRIIIMPGSGVRDTNIEKLIADTGAAEYHTAARKHIPSEMNYNNPYMQESTSITGVDEEMIKNILAIFKNTGSPS
jgi:copper homeostasis protein